MLIELAPAKTGLKYTIMPTRTRILAACFFALVAASSTAVQAEDLRSISQLVEQGQHSQALDRVNSHLASNPGDVQAQFLKGVVLAEMGKSSDAIKIFSDITTKHPELPEPHNNLAVLYADQGQYDKARRALEMAIKTHPSYATAHENLGDVYAKMATDAYDKALQLDKSNARTQTKLAMVKELFSGSTRPVQVAARAEPVVKPTSAPVVEPVAKPQAAAPVVAAEPPRPAAEPSRESKPKSEPAAKPAPEEESAAVEDAVQSWARAWSEQNVDAYLSHYGASFKVPGGESRRAWEKSRRERIGAPKSISVELSNLKVQMDGEQRATVKFRQSYRAGDVAKRTLKSLVMKKGGSKWYIEQELTDR